MSGVAAAVSVGTSAVTTGLSMFSSNKAKKAQKNALNQQGELSQSNFQATSALYSPYVDSGTNALSRLQTSMAKPLTESQLAKANEDYQAALGTWANTEARYKDMASRYNQLDANGKKAVGNSEEGFVAYFDKALSDKYKAGKPTEPTNEGRGELSQLTNMTPQEYFAAEAAAGRPIAEADQNWNTNFDQAAYLASQGKSATALNENFDMTNWLAGQGRASNALTKDFTMSDFEVDPSYAFRLAQGQKGVENSASSRGMSLSGATLKALTDYNQGSASQEYQAAVNRYNTNRSNLQGVAYNAQGQFIGDRANLVANTNTAYGQFNANQNKLYGRFVDAYGRQSGAKQQDFSNIYAMSGQGLDAARMQAQAGQTNSDNQMGVQAGIGNAQAQQSVSQGNALSGLAGTVGGVASSYFKNQPLTGSTTPAASQNALTGYTPYQPANFNLY